MGGVGRPQEWEGGGQVHPEIVVKCFVHAVTVKRSVAQLCIHYFHNFGGVI